MCHANPTPEMRADELMRRMWNEELIGITDQNKPLTTEEMLAAQKVAESRNCTCTTLMDDMKWQYHG